MEGDTRWTDRIAAWRRKHRTETLVLATLISSLSHLSSMMKTGDRETVNNANLAQMRHKYMNYKLMQVQIAYLVTQNSRWCVIMKACLWL